MALFDKDLSRLAEADLLALIEDKESEHKRIEYKRDRIGQGDAEKKEFMYDASSLANTLGGDLVIGMDAKKGVPTNLVGLGDIDADSEILRLEHMLRDGIRPPITGLQSIPVPLTNGRFAIVMRIPKSWNPPHQVTYQNAFRFYARASNGKYQIDVNELRSIFSLSGTVADRIRNFRIERTARIAIGDTPVTLLSGGVLVIHVAPFSAFGGGATFPLQEAARRADRFPTMGDNHARRRQITFDGLLVTSNSEAPPQPQRAYTQVLRSGVVEAVASSLARGHGHEWLILPHLTAYITAHVPLYISSLHSLGVEPPMAVFASLLNVNGMRLVNDPSGNGLLVDMPSARLIVDQFHFVEAILETIPRNVGECAKLLRVTLDHLANAAGLDSSPYFDDEGNYILRH